MSAGKNWPEVIFRKSPTTTSLHIMSTHCDGPSSVTRLKAFTLLRFTARSSTCRLKSSTISLIAETTRINMRGTAVVKRPVGDTSGICCKKRNCTIAGCCNQNPRGTTPCEANEAFVRFCDDEISYLLHDKTHLHDGDEKEEHVGVPPELFEQELGQKCMERIFRRRNGIALERMLFLSCIDGNRAVFISSVQTRCLSI